MNNPASGIGGLLRTSGDGLGEDMRSDARRHEQQMRAAPRTVRRELKPVDSMLDLGADCGAQVRRNGLILSSRLSFEGWRQIGSQIFLEANSCAWWVGDWLSYGETSFGNRYKQALKDTSLDYQTLRNYAWVAKKFKLSRRRVNLSFGHHSEAAPLTEAEQDLWLTRAEQFGWSRNELRRWIRAARLANRRQTLHQGATKTEALKINVAAERLDRWLQAAKRMNCGMIDWIIIALDKAAASQA